MQIPLHCVGASPMFPSLCPGDRMTLSCVGSQVMITAPATPLMLANMIAALRNGDLVATGEASPAEMISDLRALMSPPLQRAG